MARLTFELPEDLKNKVAARAVESGHASVEQYVEALVRADADDAEYADFGGPDHLRIGSADELEARLLHSLEEGGPSIEATPDFWNALKDRVRRPRPGNSRAGQ
jgi:hypothetical protein